MPLVCGKQGKKHIVWLKKVPILSLQKVIGNSWGGGLGVCLKSQTLLEEKYDAKLEFPGGEGVQNKTFHRGSMNIFWN